MLIANTTDQKFLQAILAEQQKTNELLGQLLHSMRKGEEVKLKIDRGNKNVSQSRTPSGGRANHSKSGSDSPKRGSKRQTVHDLEHGSTAAILPSDNNGNGSKRNAGSSRKRVSGKTNSKK